MAHPLSRFEPIVLQLRHRKMIAKASLDEYLNDPDPRHLHSSNVAFAIPPEAMLKGGYQVHTHQNGHQDLIRYTAPGEESRPIFTLDDLRHYRQYLEVFHPIQPEGTKAKKLDVQLALKGILGEYLLRDHVRQLLPAEAELFDEYPQKDLILRNNERYVLKRKTTGNVVLLEPKQEGKFGYRVVAEMDGLAKWEDHLYVLEAKTGVANIPLKHVLNDLFMPLQELYDGCTFHYVMMAHHHPIQVRKHDLLGFRLTEEERHRILAFRRRGIETTFLNFNESRERIREMGEHLIKEYHRLKHIPFEHKVQGVRNGNNLTILDDQGTPNLRLRKTGKETWKEVVSDK